MACLAVILNLHHNNREPLLNTMLLQLLCMCLWCQNIKCQYPLLQGITENPTNQLTVVIIYLFKYIIHLCPFVWLELIENGFFGQRFIFFLCLLLWFYQISQYFLCHNIQIATDIKIRQSFASWCIPWYESQTSMVWFHSLVHSFFFKIIAIHFNRIHCLLVYTLNLYVSNYC